MQLDQTKNDLSSELNGKPPGSHNLNSASPGSVNQGAVNQGAATSDPGPRLLLSMRHISKSFFGNKANDDISFDLYHNEVCALLGENGAGKSSLMKILFGLYKADSGQIFMAASSGPSSPKASVAPEVPNFRGAPEALEAVNINSPQDALDLGIGMVHQHFNLVDRHKVWENIALIARSGFMLKRAEVCRRIEELSEEFGLKVDPNAYIWQLSVGERQRVEIIKALYQGARVLILDEPTAVLTPQESERLFTVLKGMVKRGLSIIFISHKLKEVLEVSDRISVLRHGKLVRNLSAAETNLEELTRCMVGEESLASIERPNVEMGEEVLRVSGLCAMNHLKVKTLKNVCFQIRSGEILGLAGVSGNGQKDLAEVLSGMQKPEQGEIYYFGEKIPFCQPGNLIERGWARVPEDRKGVGSFLNFNLVENCLLEVHRRPEFCRGPLLNLKHATEYTKELIRDYDIRPPLPNIEAHSLSGGNLQKMILARELSLRPKMILVSQPTWGLDIRAVRFIQSLLLQEKAKGAAILLISEDLDEIMALSDRIAVMYEGEIVGMLDRNEATRAKIGLLMAGIKGEPEQSGNFAAKAQAEEGIWQ